MIALDNELFEVPGPLQESLQLYDVRVDATGRKAPAKVIVTLEAAASIDASHAAASVRRCELAVHKVHGLPA